MTRPKFTTSTPKKPFILRENHWNNIVQRVQRPQEEATQKEDEKKLLKYMKEESAALKKKWPENSENYREKENVNLRRRKFVSHHEKRLREMQSAKPEKRRELIEQAENLVRAREINEGAISLNSAAILCETLKVQETQRGENKVKKKEEKKRTDIQNRQDIEQSVKWIDDYNQKQIDKRERFNEYKRDLKQQIDQRASTRAEKKSSRIKMEKSHIDQHNQTQKNIIEKEKETIERKKEALRRNAIEAMLMAEQRRARLKQEEEVQKTVANIHKEGKEKIKELIVKQEKDMKIQSIKAKQVLQVDAAKLDLENKKKLAEEQEHIEKVRQEKELILNEKEKKRLEHLRKLKEQRIKEHLEEQERRKKLEAERKEEDREYFENRIKNDKISQEYTKAKFEKKVEACKENRKFLVQQIVENQEKEEQEKTERQFYDKSEIENLDKQYFNHSQELIDEAKDKDRPILPLIKTVNNYRKHNFLNIKVHELPHVISNVPIGRTYQIEESPNRIKSKFRIRYEIDELKMMNPYRGTNFNKKLNFL